MVAVLRRVLAFIGVLASVLAPASLFFAPPVRLALWRESIFGKLSSVLGTVAAAAGPATSPAWALQAEVLGAAIIAAIVSLLMATGRVRDATLTALMGIGGAFAAASALYFMRHDLVEPVAASIFILFAFGISGLMRLTGSSFGGAGAQSKTASPATVVRQGEVVRRDVSVLVCEIRDLAVLTEMYRDHPNAVARLIGKILGMAADVVRANKGTVEEIGPAGLRAVFNAPEDNPRHAEKATESALAILSRLDPINEQLEKQLGPLGIGFQPVNVSIGVSTGEAVVGDTGLKAKREFSAFGPAIDGAAELARLAKTYGPAILIGDTTEALVNRHFALLELDLRETPKAGAKPFFALLGNPVVRVSPRFKALQEGFAAFHAAYRGGEWPKAIQLLGHCAKLPGVSPRLVTLYGDRLNYLSAHYDPSEWGGVLRDVE